MMIKLTTLASLATAAGIWAGAQGGMADPASDPRLQAGEACGITVEDGGDGMLLTAWSAADRPASWRMVVTQSTGGGSFDLVQEGDIEPGADAYIALSEMLIDVDARFSAELTVREPDGLLSCRYGSHV